MKRLVVLGATGLVGSHLARSASRWSVVGAARSGAELTVDLTGEGAAELLRAQRPDALVIASAWAHVDGCERDPPRSERENVGTVHAALAAVGPSTPVVFFSTDHVLDGRGGPADEHAVPRPLSVYARHKRQVEALLLERGAALVIRTSYVFGHEARRKNFLYRVIDAARAGTPLEVPAGQAGMPTWAGWLAARAVALLDGGVTGLVHLVGPEVLTKAAWARRIAEGLQLTGVTVREVTPQEAGQRAPRPLRVELTSARVQLDHPPLLEVLHHHRDTFLR